MWALILTIVVGNGFNTAGAAITVLPGFMTETACIRAATQWRQEVPHDKVRSAVCVRLTENPDSPPRKP